MAIDDHPKYQDWRAAREKRAEAERWLREVREAAR